MSALKMTPFLLFDGNCDEAVELYEKALGGRAVVLRYKDTPPNMSYPPPFPGDENRILQARIIMNRKIVLYLCDINPVIKFIVGTSAAVQVNFDSEDAARHAFEVLKEGGQVLSELKKAFWSEYYAILNDKFGVHWLLEYDLSGKQIPEP